MKPKKVLPLFPKSPAGFSENTRIFFPAALRCVLTALCLLLVAGSPLLARGRTSSPPGCLLSTAQFGALTGITCTDTSTVVHLLLHSARLQSDSLTAAPCLLLPSGEQLPLRRAEGWKPGEAYRIGRQQERAVEWTFPPLPRGTKQFDLCGKTHLFGPFAFYGIRPKPYRRLLKRPAIPREEALPAVRMGRDTATVRLRLLGYRQGMPRKVSYVRFSTDNGLDNYLPGQFELDATGCATLRLTLFLPERLSFNLGNGLLFNCLAAPGETTLVEVDMAACHDRTNSLQTAVCPAPDGKKEARFTPVRYGGYLAGLQNFIQSPAFPRADTPDSLRKAIATLEIPASWKQYIGREIDLSLADPELNPQGFLTLDCLNEAESLLSPAYTAIVARLPEQFLADYAARHGTREGILFDLHRLIRWQKQLYYRTPLTAAQCDSLRLLPPEAAAEVEAGHDALLQRMRQNEQKDGYEITTIDPALTDADGIFRLLLQPLAGKTVVVDFWETWCRPCLMAHQSLRSLKAELEEKPVVWLYLSSASSPEALWADMICDIPGRHVRLSSEQAEAVRKKLALQGVPTYLIFAPDGTLRYRQTGFPGNDTLRSEIQKASQKL